jgi:hypothetical protein
VSREKDVIVGGQTQIFNVWGPLYENMRLSFTGHIYRKE